MKTITKPEWLELIDEPKIQIEHLWTKTTTSVLPIPGFGIVVRVQSVNHLKPTDSTISIATAPIENVRIIEYRHKETKEVYCRFVEKTDRRKESGTVKVEEIEKPKV